MSVDTTKSDSSIVKYNLLDEESPQVMDREKQATRESESAETRSLSDDQTINKSKEDIVSEETPKPVGFFSLFRYSSACDRVLILTGSLVGIISGAQWPAVIILFGNFINTFVDRATNQTSNSILVTNKGNSSEENFLDKTVTMAMYNAIFGVAILLLNYIIVCSFRLSAANQAYKIRCLFMASILRQDMSWFDTHQTGDFASRITGDLSRIEDGIGEKAGLCINFISTTLCCFVCGFYFGWKLALVVLSLTPVLTIATAIITKIQAAVSGQELQAYGEAGAVAEEVLSSIRTVVAFGGEKKEIQRYERFLTPARKMGIKRGLMTSIGSGLTWFCIFGGYALTFWYGVKLVVEDKDKKDPVYTAGSLIIVFSNIMMASMNFGQTAPYFEAFAAAKGAAAKVFSIIERKPVIDSSSDGGDKPGSLCGNISLENVHFSYPSRPDVPVLKGVSLNVKTGETVAIVGESGCGKSTIIQLILRFYDTNDGCVEVDNRDVKELNVGWLRSSVGFVGQEPILFSTTIAENIRYGKLDATQDELEAAAKIANAHDFISDLPLKYSTLVGERGTQLSGGQKQRIALARALVKNPKILLLDEATSALDTESEAIVQAALDKAREGRTTVIIAHRLSTIRDANKIFVLSDGKVKEVGSHDELMEAKGLYYQLVLSQTQENSTEASADILDENSAILKRSLSTKSHISDETSSGKFSRQISSLSGKDDSAGVQYDFKEEKYSTTSIRIKLLKMSSSEWIYLIVGSLSSLIMGLHPPAYGILFGFILGVLSEEKDKIMEDNAIYCYIFLLMSVTSFVASFLQVFMFSLAGEKLTSRLRKMIFTTIITQDMAWFDQPENSVGSLCSKLSSDASDVQGIMGARLSTILQALSTFVACLVIGFIFNIKLGSVVLAFVPLIMIGMYFEGRVAAGQIVDDKAGAEKASKVAIEAIDCIRTVAALHQEKTFYTQFSSALLEPHKKSKIKAHVRGLSYAFVQSVQVFANSTAWYYGSILVNNNELDYADFFRVMQSIIVSTAMVGKAVAFTPDYKKAQMAAARIFKMLELKPAIDALSQEGLILDNVKGKVNFRKVHFNYPSRSNVKVLKGLDLEIESGKTIALVGSSGCGKSTCVQLLERFYDVQGGKVALDDENVKDVNVSHLRSHFGLVSQEPVLFSCSIAENIAYGDNSRSVDTNEIISAAQQANIHNFITTLPQGYETPVGDKGAQLSGGQKQRVAIARALVRNPKILLLDEATSALDAESERVVQEALDKARTGRTCLVIAHRLTTIQNADNIAVIHEGQIVERGTHQELMKKKGYYYNLYRTQK